MAARPPRQRQVAAGVRPGPTAHPELLPAYAPSASTPNPAAGPPSPRWPCNYPPPSWPTYYTCTPPTAVR
ncbi:MAG: hypothetical protein ACRDSZ_23085 [Pseudonocardiaceae bacterium]